MRRASAWHSRLEKLAARRLLCGRRMRVSNPRGSDPVLVALAWWSAWCALPALLALGLSPSLASLFAFVAVAAALLATRPNTGDAWRARVALACGMAIVAGALAQP